MAAIDAEACWEVLQERAIAAGYPPDGASLAPVLRGFHDSGFQEQVQQFVAERAAQFAVCCQDGSHPLIWTQYFNEYRELYEGRLDQVLAEIGLSKEQFSEVCLWLRAHAEIFEEDSEGLYPFIEAATSSEDYNSFLNVMFADVRKLQAGECPPPLPPSEGGDVPAPPAPLSQEIDVTVPEGLSPGDAMAVEYLGTRYDLVVPEGFGPGMSFRATVAVVP
eukprot:TRINITY_DN75363_c0_g1_i1.p1 TRINITY_DN75363_c0_g1~~TRINITY_DN75363_c0_g1_i1.p1  ORF type:complete len:220 (-),score=28.22 TRINITY_DN75363_c0_g1_i1:144-803(-)